MQHLTVTVTDGDSNFTSYYHHQWYKYSLELTNFSNNMDRPAVSLQMLSLLLLLLYNISRKV